MSFYLFNPARTKHILHERNLPFEMYFLFQHDYYNSQKSIDGKILFIKNDVDKSQLNVIHHSWFYIKRVVISMANFKILYNFRVVIVYIEWNKITVVQTFYATVVKYKKKKYTDKKYVSYQHRFFSPFK